MKEIYSILAQNIKPICFVVLCSTIGFLAGSFKWGFCIGLIIPCLAVILPLDKK